MLPTELSLLAFEPAVMNTEPPIKPSPPERDAEPPVDTCPIFDPDEIVIAPTEPACVSPVEIKIPPDLVCPKLPSPDEILINPEECPPPIPLLIYTSPPKE